MTRFIRNIAVFILIVAIFYAVIVAFMLFVIGDQYKYDYQASLIDKVERLESINEPKIILVGNSNLSFGIDSKRLEDALNMPVVNLGLHGGLGNAFHEEIAKININEDDIIIVCHTSFSDLDKIDDRLLAWITIGNNPKLGSILRARDLPAMFAAYLGYVKNTMLVWLRHQGNNDRGDCYSRNAFNEYGDVVFKPEDGQMDVNQYFLTPSNEIKVPLINDICINRLNKYNDYVSSQGASLIVAGYPIAYGEYASFDQYDFIAFKNELEEVLNCPVISDYTDYFYPYELFYNTILHLTEKGAKIRTDQLISDLQNWLLTKY